MTTIFSDLALARRLESVEAEAGRAFVEAHGQASPEVGAEWKREAGAYLLYDGPRSPITQTFCLGLFGEMKDDHFEKIESFFQERGAPVYHEISPLAHASIWPLLCKRGYHPVEFSSMMFLPLEGRPPVGPPANEAIRVHLVGEADREIWAATLAEGWSELAEFADQILELGRVVAARAGAVCFLAELDGKPVAGGAFFAHDGVGLMSGASTIPGARNQGAQRALLDARLRYAEEMGCDLALVNVQAGSGSQRNAERHGFRIAYTRTKWGLLLT